MTPPNDETRVAPSQAAARSDRSVTPTSQTEADNDGTLIPQHVPATQLRAVGLVAVPGYEVSREIARGGMGVVYSAHDPIFERQVAVKVMHAGQDAGRFVVESKVTAQLPHPGIPPVYELGKLADGRPFLAMKLIEGGTLSAELRAADRKSDLPRLLGIFEQICLTVGFAHSRRIVHRDLKPANVMVGAFGEVLVMDWGLAKQLPAQAWEVVEESTEQLAASEVHADATQAGEVKGTPAYMAPEQARGEPVDARADVFSLGAILAVILTGKPPFVGSTVIETVQNAAAGKLTECFTELETCDADPELIAVAKQCLSADAADRYSDGKAVAEAIEEYRTGVEERLRQAERDRAVSEAEAREQRKRRKVQLALAAAIGLFLVAGGAVAWYSDRQASERKLKDERAEADRQRGEAESKATETRLKGERDLELRLKGEQARQGVQANLALASDLRKEFKFSAAGAALEQAAMLATSGAPELLPEVKQAQTALAFVVKLDDIRYRKWLYTAEPDGKGFFATKLAPGEYRKAFAERGLDLTTLDPAEAVKQIANSPVKADLVAAVDDWALYEKDEALRNRLLQIARGADPGAWLDKLRSPAIRGDKTALAKLAADPEALNQSSAAISALTTLMESADLDPGPLFLAARERHPTDFELAFTLGQWRAQNSATDPRIIAPYEVARSLRPETRVVWNNLAGTLGNMSQFDSATAMYREAIRRFPKDAGLWYNLGVVLERQDKHEEATAAFREAIKINSHYGEPYLMLGLGLQLKGDIDGAIATFQEGTKADPTNPRLFNNLGNVLVGKGKREEAIAAYREAIKIDPALSVAHFNLGFQLYSKGDHDAAIAAYLDALKVDPPFLPAHGNLAAAYFAKGEVDKAITTFREAIKHEPKNAALFQNFGIVLRQKGDTDGAITAFSEAVKLDPDVAGTHEDLAALLFKKGDLDGAVREWKETVRLDPTRFQTMFNLAGTLVNQGKFKDAIPYGRTLVKAAPNSGIAHAVLGAALEGVGDAPGARAAFAEAARIDPGQFGVLLKRLPLDVAPPPREAKRP